ncbi:hypothetical protein GGS21DRAFT_509165 [Xylaria nigripes]|nr:hypothetical protein GGS21DRAFT_509165 [Xylaria nigripes]
MNRICHSSYGTLEAVINLVNFREVGPRKLVHFSRDRMTGEWNVNCVISDTPKAGGSIVQNMSKRYGAQVHGDFEVVVPEIDGAVRHYTRDNSIDGEYIWKMSAVVNTEISNITLMESNTNAIDAAPLIQSRIPMGAFEDGVCLETALLEENGNMTHYRCPQPGYEAKSEAKEHRHPWFRCGVIARAATGPACLYLHHANNLMAIVPVISGIGRYRLHEKADSWTLISMLPEMEGPGCAYSVLTSSEIMFRAIIRDGYDITEKVLKESTWEETEVTLPSSLDHIAYTKNHKTFPINPIALASHFYHGIGESHDTEALVFHATGSGHMDAWMILHWTLPAGTEEWIVSGVVLRRVIGMPL